MEKVTIDDILNSRKGTTLLYRAVRGSHAFGLATEKSDIDEICVYMCSVENLLDLGKDYQPSVENETHDIVAYEIGRFCELLDKSNPNTLEAIYIPDDCVKYVHPIFKELLDMREKFLSKTSFKPYVGYAKSQIDKARGLNKAISKDPVEKRLGILDFCYVPFRQGSTKIMNWMEYRNLKPKYCGAVNIPNMFNIAGVYYDWGQMFQEENITFDDIASAFHDTPEYTTIDIIRVLKDDFKEHTAEEIEELNRKLKKAQFSNMIDFIMQKYKLYSIEEIKNWYEANHNAIGYRGLTNDDMTSDEIRLSSVSKGEDYITLMSYNKDAYSTHCREYKEYHNWLKHRNEERFRTNTAHGKNYDSKNMYSCCRIMLTAVELAKTGIFRLRRPDDREFLLSVKTGELSYDEIIKFANNLNAEMLEAMKTSKLPENVEDGVLDKYLFNVRIYQLSKYFKENNITD